MRVPWFNQLTELFFCALNFWPCYTSHYQSSLAQSFKPYQIQTCDTGSQMHHRQCSIISHWIYSHTFSEQISIPGIEIWSENITCLLRWENFCMFLVPKQRVLMKASMQLVLNFETIYNTASVIPSHTHFCNIWIYSYFCLIHWLCSMFIYLCFCFVQLKCFTTYHKFIQVEFPILSSCAFTVG